MSQNKNPLISIIMPVLNRGDMIEKAICSVIDQQYHLFELIILDGGSTDNTVDVIKKYEKYITYWHSQPDGSAAFATNIGIEKSKGDLIALLMSDDYYEPELFHHISEAAQENPDVEVFTCGGRVVTLDDETLIQHDSARELSLNFYNICYGATGICFRFIRKSLYERIGVYIPFAADKKLMLTNDKEFLLRAWLDGVKDQYVDHIGYTHLAHPGSYSFGNRSSFARHCTEHMEIATNYLSENNLSFSQKIKFIYWYNDQAAKLFLFHVMNRNYSAAKNMAIQAIKKYNILWPMVCCVTGVRAVVKRLR